jgi:hypothetical protein
MVYVKLKAQNSNDKIAQRSNVQILDTMLIFMFLALNFDPFWPWYFDFCA